MDLLWVDSLMTGMSGSIEGYMSQRFLIFLYTTEVVNSSLKLDELEKQF